MYIYGFIKSNWKLAVVIIFVCLSVSLPYIYGILATPNNKVFTGVHTLNPGDTYSYLAWMQQAKAGNILLKDLYSTEEQTVGIFHPLFYILGQVSNITNLQPILIYHLSRVALSAVLLLVMYRFLNLIYTKSQATLAVLITATSSGLGWHYPTISMDVWMTEAITFLNMYESVINVVATIALIGIFYVYVKYLVTDKQIKWLLITAFFINLLTFLHPYDLVIALSVLFTLGIARALFLRHYIALENFIWLTILATPSLLWQIYTVLHNEVFLGWLTQQPERLSPPVLAYILGLGPIALLAIIGAIVLYIEKKITIFWQLMICWALVQVVLAYNPIYPGFQRKLAESIQIPLALLGNYTIFRGYDYTKKYVPGSVAYFAIACLLISMFQTNAYIIKQDVAAFKTGQSPYYITKSTKDTATWIEKHIKKDRVILTSAEFGNLLPGMTGNRVYLGHGDQTLFEDRKYSMALRNLNAEPKATDPLEKFMAQEHIGCIVVDSYLPIHPEILTNRGFLNLMFSNKENKVFCNANQ